MEIVNLPEKELLEKWGHLLESTANIFTWTSPGELCRLAEYASRAIDICELGSYHGKSALVMSKANPNAQLLCIDNFENEGCELIMRENTKDVARRILVLKGTSSRLVGRADRFDFCFIDAGHLEPDVTADIANLRSFMKPGAVMSGHDWRKDMKDGVNRGVLNHFKLSQIVVHESIWAVQL